MTFLGNPPALRKRGTPKLEVPHRPRLSPLKWNRWPVSLQVAISLALAVAIVLVGFLILPDDAQVPKRQISLAVHESGHAFGALILGGSVEDIRLRANGSGEAVVRADDDVLSAGMGLIFPSLVAAICLVMGVTRVGVSVVLFIFAGSLFYLGYNHANDMIVRWALWGWTIFCVAFAFPGVPHWIKSAGLVAVSMVLQLGVIDGLGYLWIEQVPDQEAMTAAPGATISPQLPSDVRIIANAFEASGIEGARIFILILMGTICFLALCTLVRFLITYRRR